MLVLKLGGAFEFNLKTREPTNLTLKHGGANEFDLKS